MTSVACDTYEKKNSCRVLVGKHEGRRLHEMPKRKWKDNINADLQGIRWQVEDWLHLALDRNNWRAAVNSQRTFNINKILGMLIIWRPISFSMSTLLYGVIYFELCTSNIWQTAVSTALRKRTAAKKVCCGHILHTYAILTTNTRRQSHHVPTIIHL